MIRWRWLAAILCAGGCAASDMNADPGGVRIMPLGDSITQGSLLHPSYRRPLWHMLTNAGHRVDFVGSQRRNYLGGPLRPDFDPEHEGHWGWTINEVLQELERWVQAAQPDAVLVHLGSNDLFGGESPEAVAAELADLIERIRSVKPRVAIFLALLIPAQGMEAIFAETNKHIRLLERLAGPESPVIVVDMFEGFDPARHTYDGVHPNDAGERLMASRWFEALDRWLRERQTASQS